MQTSRLLTLGSTFDLQGEAGEGEAGARQAARDDPHRVQRGRDRRGDGEGEAALPAADVRGEDEGSRPGRRSSSGSPALKTSLRFPSAVSPEGQRDQGEEGRRLPPEPHQVFPRAVQVRRVQMCGGGFDRS